MVDARRSRGHRLARGRRGSKFAALCRRDGPEVGVAVSLYGIGVKCAGEPAEIPAPSHVHSVIFQNLMTRTRLAGLLKS